MDDERTVHGAFWRILPIALIIAEADRGFPGRAVDILGDLLALENDRGQTGYLGNEDNGVTGAKLAAQRVRELIATRYDDCAPATWMQSDGL